MNITTKRLKEIIMEEVQNASSPVTEAEEQEEKEEEKPKANFDRHGPDAKRDKDGNRINPKLKKEDIARIIHEETVKAVKEGIEDMRAKNKERKKRRDKETAKDSVDVRLPHKEGVVDMDGETVITGPDGDASPEARGLARQEDLQATMLKAAMEIKNGMPQKAYETLLRALAAAGMDEKYLDDFMGYGELEEGATDYHKYINQGYSHATAQSMASGGPEKKAEYDKLRKQGYSDSEARRFVYGRSYSAMGQR